jgi:hypothetical protein
MEVLGIRVSERMVNFIVETFKKVVIGIAIALFLYWALPYIIIILRWIYCLIG